MFDNFLPILALGPSVRYPVYRSTTTGDFLYLYDWGKGLGMNWFISLEVSKPKQFSIRYMCCIKTTPLSTMTTKTHNHQVNDNNRGIESPDLEKVDDRCPEKVTTTRAA